MNKENKVLLPNLANFSVFLAVLILISVSTWSSYKLIPHWESEHSDLPVYILALATMVAAALTLWVSWLIKAEAKEISGNIVRTNSYLMRMETLKSDYSLLLDVAAIKLEQESQVWHENAKDLATHEEDYGTLEPIKEWHKLPVASLFKDVMNSNGRLSNSELVKVNNHPNYEEVTGTIRKSIFRFIWCFKEASNDFENFNIIESILEIMESSESGLSKDSNKDFKELIKDLKLCNSNISADYSNEEERRIIIESNIHKYIALVMDLLSRLASKSTNSANLMFMFDAYKLLILPNENEIEVAKKNNTRVGELIWGRWY